MTVFRILSISAPARVDPAPAGYKMLGNRSDHEFYEGEQSIGLKPCTVR